MAKVLSYLYSVFCTNLLTSFLCLAYRAQARRLSWTLYGNQLRSRIVMAQCIHSFHPTALFSFRRLLNGSDCSWSTSMDVSIICHRFFTLVSSTSHGIPTTLSRGFTVPIFLKLVHIFGSSVGSLWRPRDQSCWNCSLSLPCFVGTRFDRDSLRPAVYLMLSCIGWCTVFSCHKPRKSFRVSEMHVWTSQLVYSNRKPRKLSTFLGTVFMQSRLEKVGCLLHLRNFGSDTRSLAVWP